MICYVLWKPYDMPHHMGTAAKLEQLCTCTAMAVRGQKIEQNKSSGKNDIW